MSATQRPAAAARAAVRLPRAASEQAARADALPPRLRLVTPNGTRASSGAYVVLLGAFLGVGLLGLLAVNTVLTQGSFATASLTAKQDALAEQEQQLQQEVAKLQSPQQLAAAATALGMVGTHNPVFIDTRTGQVLGVPQAAPRPAPMASSTPAATASAGPTAGATASAGATPSAATKPSAGTKPTPHPSPTSTR